MKRFLLLLLLTLSTLLMFACSPNGSVNGDGEEGINDELLNNDPLDKESGSEEGNTEILPPLIDVSTRDDYSIIVKTESSFVFETFFMENAFDNKQDSDAYVSIDAEPVECGDDSITLRVYYGFDRSIAEQYDLSKWYSAQLKVYNEAKEIIFTRPINGLHEDDDNFIDAKDKVGYVTNGIFKKSIDVKIPFEYLIDRVEHIGSNGLPYETLANDLHFELTLGLSSGETFKETKSVYYHTPEQGTQKYEKTTFVLDEYTEQAEKKIVENLRLKFAYLWTQYPAHQEFVNFEQPPTATDSEMEILVCSLQKYVESKSDIDEYQDCEFTDEYYPGWVRLALTEGKVLTDLTVGSDVDPLPRIYSVAGDSISFICQIAFTPERMEELKKSGGTFYLQVKHRLESDDGGPDEVTELVTVPLTDFYTNKNYVLSGQPNKDGLYRFDVNSYSDAQLISLPLEWFTHETDKEAIIRYAENWARIEIGIVQKDKDGNVVRSMGINTIRYIKRGDRLYLVTTFIDPEALAVRSLQNEKV